MPVRDGRPWLEEALASLARQTLADHEVVAVDDGSTDGSSDVLDRWAAHDPRVHVLHRPAEGLVAALNAGLTACRAPLVARMDADDVSHPRRLELQTGRLDAHPDVGVVGCRVVCVPRARLESGFRRYERWLNGLVDHAAMARERFVDTPVAHPSVMLRRQVLEAVGGWRDRSWPEDHDLWLRLFEAGVRFAKVDRPLLFWRDRPDRLTRSDDRYRRERFLACNAHFLVRGPLADAARIVVWGAGPTGRRLARALEGEGRPVDGFVDVDPAKIGRTARGVQIVDEAGLVDWLAPDTVVLAAVAARGARELVRARLTALGLTEGREWWGCA
jgi:glycosyltransferase involved in cell wall biosynthesis